MKFHAEASPFCSIWSTHNTKKGYFLFLLCSSRAYLLLRTYLELRGWRLRGFRSSATGGPQWKSPAVAPAWLYIIAVPKFTDQFSLSLSFCICIFLFLLFSWSAFKIQTAASATSSPAARSTATAYHMGDKIFRIVITIMIGQSFNRYSIYV